MELHVEQGLLLDTLSVPLGIVEVITGVCNLKVTLKGQNNNNGTTPMNMRADAFLGMFEFAAQIHDVIEMRGTRHSRITIGYVSLEPNYSHTVSGKTTFQLSCETQMKK